MAKLSSPAKKKSRGISSAKPKKSQRALQKFTFTGTLKEGSTCTKKTSRHLFRFIDSNNYGRITMQDLKKKVSLFAKEMTSRDFKFLMAGKNDIELKKNFMISLSIMNLKTLTQLLKLSNFMTLIILDSSMRRD
jgi:hypothetical protein